MSGPQDAQAKQDRLALKAARTGYVGVLLEAIADAALPAHTDGEPFTEHETHVLCDALEVLAQAGIRPEQLPDAIAHYQTKGEHWRQPFWARLVRRAARRYNDAPHFGVSPLETDEVRLARWGPAPDDWAGEQPTSERLAACPASPRTRSPRRDRGERQGGEKHPNQRHPHKGDEKS
jgi:hypothetical protein